MSTPPIKKIILWLLTIFLIYAILTSPGDAADIVGSAWDVIANGVTNIVEVQFGYDGIVFASDKAGADFVLTPKDVFLALAKDVVVDGKVVPNTAAKWKDVNPSLPDQDIMAFIPGTKHGTREVFEEKVIHAGCKESGAEEVLVKELGEEKGEEACGALRTDGKSVDIDGDYTETLARIERTVDAWLQGDVVDIDAARTGTMLTLSLPDRSQFIVNAQPPLRELWLAARRGGFHFRHDAQRACWVDTRSGEEFFALLSACASEQARQPLAF